MDRAVKNALIGCDPWLLRFLVQWLLPKGQEEVPHAIVGRIEELESPIKALESRC